MANDTEQLAAPVHPRQLMRAAGRAVLATTLPSPLPWPCASLVLVAFDHDGAALLLLSDLAEHTRNLQADPRVSLLIDGTAGHAEPLAGPRLTLLGLAARDASERLRRRFLARHPSAEAYAGFADFHLYRVAIERGHLVAAFGRIRWVEAPELRVAVDVAAFDETAASVAETINRDHAPAVDALAARIARTTASGWHLSALDPDGAWLRRDGTTIRFAFDEPRLDRAALLDALGMERQS